MSIQLTSFGAAKEVTGSNHILTVDNEKVMIDFGMFQGRRAASDLKNRNLEYDLKNINAVILTHAHLDHCGRLPLLALQKYMGDIFSTPATRDIATIVMADSAHIQEKDAEYLKKKDASSTFTPLYKADSVTDILKNFVTVSYDREFKVTDHIKATFKDAGHIVGSAMAVVDCGNDRKIAFTGDLGREGLPIVRDPDILPPVDYIVCESTYGNRTHDPIEDCCDELADVINQTVKRGGKVIIPAFAIERTQDLLYFLSKLRTENRIPKIPIYVDSPMAFNVTSVFRIHQECYDDETIQAFTNHNANPFGFEGLHFITDVTESMGLNLQKGSCIILSSSGMCEAGRILHHLKNNIENPANTIIAVGYMAEHTLGRRIVERDKEVRIFGKAYKLKAQVATLNTFSAHGDYVEICRWFKKQDLNRLKKVFLVHGEGDAFTFFAEELKKIGVKEVQIVEPHTPYTLWA